MGKWKRLVKHCLALIVLFVSLASPAFATPISPVEVELVQVDSAGTGLYFVRSWTDTNGNLLPDCNLLSPLGNHECGAVSVFGGTPLLSALQADPGPGGSNSVLTYTGPTVLGELETPGDVLIEGGPGSVLYVPLPGQPGSAELNPLNGSLYGGLAYDFQTDGSITDIRFNGGDITLNYYADGVLPSSLYSNTVTFINGSEAPVPEPASLLLLGTGLVTMVGRRVRQRRTSESRR
jgi:hypothetical protein